MKRDSRTLHAWKNAGALFAKWTALALTALMLLCGCGTRKEKYQAVYLDLFDTVTVITGYAASEAEFDETAAQIYGELLLCHELFDIYHDHDGRSGCKAINDMAGVAPVQVDERVIDLLERGRGYFQMTGGKCNMAMGSVLRLWHDARDQGVLPEKGALEAAGGHMQAENVQIDREQGTVFLPDAAMSLDVGAIGKGYAAQLVCEMLREMGKTGWLISIGGNVVSVGAKPDGSLWQIGIEDPLGGENVAMLSAADVAVLTSGSYQRYFDADGVRYHHIIDPDTLYPLNTYLSVTVVAKDSALADALSTALFNMPEADALQLAGQTPDVEAFFIRADGTTFETDGFGAYRK